MTKKKSAQCFRVACLFNDIYEFCTDIVPVHRCESLYTNQCTHCGAHYAIEETVKGRKVYTRCCAEGAHKINYFRYDDTAVNSSIRKLLCNLFDFQHQHSRLFHEDIRLINNSLAFGSIVMRQTTFGKNVRGPPVLSLAGNIVHRIGPATPHASQAVHRYMQCYFVEPNSIKYFFESLSQISKDLIEQIRNEIKQHNHYYQQLSTAMDQWESLSLEDRQYFEVKIVPCEKYGNNPSRTHNAPPQNVREVAALLHYDPSDPKSNSYRAITVQYGGGRLREISSTNANYMPFCYPLLHMFAEPGWHPQWRFTNKKRKNSDNDERVTIHAIAKYLIQMRDRKNEELKNDILLCAGKLFQQYILDLFCVMEGSRLEYVRQQQDTFRQTTVDVLRQSLQDRSIENPGRKLLPSSYVGGPRWYTEQYHDACARTEVFKCPDLFITFTCNPNWEEIQESLRESQFQNKININDRPDIVARVFDIKLKSLLADLLEKKIFGDTQAIQAIVEWQKRGLPHAHILLWLDPKDKPKTVEHYDRICSAEIPDPDTHPELFNLVKQHMIHGPCGQCNPENVCCVKGKCTKGFPKPYSNRTSQPEKGYPILRRRAKKDGGRTLTLKKGGKEFIVDNSWVVPYNAYLLLRYKAHINVEICNSIAAIKYIHKYIYKGNSKALVLIRNKMQEEVDEIKLYEEARFCSPMEAMNRLFSLTLTEKSPPVERLKYHLPGQQPVTYSDERSAETLIEEAELKGSMLLAFFKAVESEKANPIPDEDLIMSNGQRIPRAEELTYPEFPKYFLYVQEGKEVTWRRYKGRGASAYGITNKIGRLYQASITHPELYCLRMLLLNVKGPTSFDDLKTVDGTVYNTFKEACVALGYYADDREWINCLREATSYVCDCRKLRDLFAMICHNNDPQDPGKLWNKFKDELCDDFRRKRISKRFQSDLPQDQNSNNITDEDYSEGLYALEDILIQISGGSTTLQKLNLPQPTHPRKSPQEGSFMDLHAYDKEYERQQLERHRDAMNPEQRLAFEEIVNAINEVKNGRRDHNSQNYFLDAPGGTGKAFVVNNAIRYMIVEGIQFTACAFSGIAATLLIGGRTAHSSFKLPLDSTGNVTSAISTESNIAKHLRKCKVFILDEGPMLNKSQLQAINDVLNDIMGVQRPADANYAGSTEETAFADKLVIASGDFRQTLPVIPRESRAGICEQLISRSYLWETFKTLRLIQNERVNRLTNGLDENNRKECREFADWLLQIGDGTAGEIINIPKKYVFNPRSTIKDFLQWVYPELGQQVDPELLRQQPPIHERGILCPLNSHANELNALAVNLLPGNLLELKSADSGDKSVSEENYDRNLMTTELLNSIDVTGVPEHNLKLKIGAPMMLIRNLNVKEGLCNGTRLIFLGMVRKYLMQVRVVGGPFNNKVVELPRIKFTVKSSQLPFTFIRQQYPVRLAFAITINKAQGQSLKRVGVYLLTPVFSHGQLYVALSRSGVPSETKVFIPIQDSPSDEHKNNADGSITTVNIVWDEALPFKK